MATERDNAHNLTVESACTKCKRRPRTEGYLRCDICREYGRAWAERNRASRAVPLEQRTGTRRSVHELHAKGLTAAEIARSLDIASSAISYHLSRPVDESMLSRPRKDAGTTRQRCRCGVTVSSLGNRCNQCRDRDMEAETRARQAERSRRLIVQAERTGLVPTLREAQGLLGIGRSVAGDELLRTFGPDPRAGFERRSTPRPYQQEVISHAV